MYSSREKSQLYGHYLPVYRKKIRLIYFFTYQEGKSPTPSNSGSITPCVTHIIVVSGEITVLARLSGSLLVLIYSNTPVSRRGSRPGPKLEVSEPRESRLSIFGTKFLYGRIWRDLAVLYGSGRLLTRTVVSMYRIAYLYLVCCGDECVILFKLCPDHIYTKSCLFGLKKCIRNGAYRSVHVLV